jgi:hypothetical protein
MSVPCIYTHKSWWLVSLGSHQQVHSGWTQVISDHIVCVAVALSILITRFRDQFLVHPLSLLKLRAIARPLSPNSLCSLPFLPIWQCLWSWYDAKLKCYVQPLLTSAIGGRCLCHLCSIHFVLLAAIECAQFLCWTLSEASTGRASQVRHPWGQTRALPTCLHPLFLHSLWQHVK